MQRQPGTPGVLVNLDNNVASEGGRGCRRTQGVEKELAMGALAEVNLDGA